MKYLILGGLLAFSITTQANDSCEENAVDKAITYCKENVSSIIKSWVDDRCIFGATLALTRQSESYEELSKVCRTDEGKKEVYYSACERGVLFIKALKAEIK